jgi:hypothetical protein
MFYTLSIRYNKTKCSNNSTETWKHTVVEKLHLSIKGKYMNYYVS